MRARRCACACGRIGSSALIVAPRARIRRIPPGRVARLSRSSTSRCTGHTRRAAPTIVHARRVRSAREHVAASISAPRARGSRRLPYVRTATLIACPPATIAIAIVERDARRMSRRGLRMTRGAGRRRGPRADATPVPRPERAAYRLPVAIPPPGAFVHDAGLAQLSTDSAALRARAARRSSFCARPFRTARGDDAERRRRAVRRREASWRAKARLVATDSDDRGRSSSVRSRASTCARPRRRSSATAAAGRPPVALQVMVGTLGFATTISCGHVKNRDDRRPRHRHDQDVCRGRDQHPGGPRDHRRRRGALDRPAQGRHHRPRGDGRAIEAATERAERMAGVHISHVYVGVTGEHMQSTNNRGVVAVSGEEREVVAATCGASSTPRRSSTSPPTGRSSTRCRATSRVDGQEGVTDPVGMAGRAARSRHAHHHRRQRRFITNVLKCVHRAGLEPAGLVFEPLASSAATLLVGREARRRRAARHRRRHDRHRGLSPAAARSTRSTIPVGGNILTNDIALGLKTTFAEAETRQAHVRLGRARRRRGRRVVRRQDARRPHARATVNARAAARDRRAARSSRSSAWRKAQIAEKRAARRVAGRGRHHRRRRAPARHRNGGRRSSSACPVRIGVPTAIGGLTDAVKQPRVRDGRRARAVRPQRRRRIDVQRPQRATHSRDVTRWFGDMWN